MGQILRFRGARRKFARHPVSQPVALVHDNATVATGIVVNVSPGGLQALCDRYTSDSLHPSDLKLTRRNAPRVDAHFKLPLVEGLVKLDVECRMVYMERADDNCFLIGLEFVALDGKSRERLTRFLTEASALADT